MMIPLHNFNHNNKRRKTKFTSTQKLLILFIAGAVGLGVLIKFFDEINCMLLVDNRTTNTDGQAHRSVMSLDGDASPSLLKERQTNVGMHPDDTTVGTAEAETETNQSDAASDDGSTLTNGDNFALPLLLPANHETITGNKNHGLSKLQTTSDQSVVEKKTVIRGGQPNRNAVGMPLEGPDDEDPCSVNHWIKELIGRREHEEFLNVVNENEIGFHHITFTIDGARNRIANDVKDGTHNREDETGYSISCLHKTFPGIQYSNIDLGDFTSYQAALAHQHDWLAGKSTKLGSPPYNITFVIDTDVYANPKSPVTKDILARVLTNVDLVLAYNPERVPPNTETGRINLQLDGVQAGIMGMRHNKRTELFNACVANVLRRTYKWSIRQQRAINQVLNSELGQFLRIKWLPAEFHCWSPHVTRFGDFFINEGPEVQKLPCYFVHSHRLAKEGDLDEVCRSS